jgi:pantetheine-phosphate adenylyltransferase
MAIAIYAGSFDPVTRGHEDLMWRSLTFVDKLIVAVAVNSAKQPLFTVAERVGLIRDSIGNDSRIEVREFTGLLVDFEYEYQMALMNRHLNANLETVFMVPSIDRTYISSSVVREVARYGGNTSGLVHPVVDSALRARFTELTSHAGAGES